MFAVLAIVFQTVCFSAFASQDLGAIDLSRWFEPWRPNPELVAPDLSCLEGPCLDGSVDDSLLDGTRYRPVLAGFQWIVPSPLLPAEAAPDRSNNNVGIAYWRGRLFLAWRTSRSHFASSHARIHVVSSRDFGQSWEYETTFALGADVREPHFLAFRGRLFFTFFEAGTNPVKFQPKALWRSERLADGRWTARETWGEPGEIVWSIKERYGRAWLTSYTGNHYGGGKGKLRLHFKVSDDGLNWASVASGGDVHVGGDSEAEFEFDAHGDLWAVTRNEDGDDSGFGSNVAVARRGNLGSWEFPAKSDPERYDSPRMFRHAGEIYMVARRDIGGPFGSGFRIFPFAVRKFFRMIAYSLRPKRTTLYWLDRSSRKVVPLLDLPSAGDTAFPSILRTGLHTFLVANYTSPLEHPGRHWFWGQVSPQGTRLYFTQIAFRPAP